MGGLETIRTAAGQWSWYVWHVTWQASLLAAVVVLIAWIGRRHSVRLAYGLLVLALLKFAVWPTCSLFTGLFSHLTPALTAPADPRGPTWLAWLMMVHVVGAAAVAAWVLIQLLHLARLTRCAEPISSGPVYRRLSYMARKMGLHRSVRLLACREGTSPMAYGVVTPSVIVPTSMLEQLPPRQVATVLAHELAHHRRGDLWINWLQVVLSIVWWFNPLIWLLNRAVRKMREDCCDDLLLQEELATDDGYCQTLLVVAAQMSRSRRPAWNPGFAERMHPLGRRIIRIMDPDRHRRSAASRLRGPALAMLALLLLPGVQMRSLLLPVPPRRTGVAALGAGLPGLDELVAASHSSARRRDGAADRGYVGGARGTLAIQLKRPRPGRPAPATLDRMPGDVAAATTGWSARPLSRPAAVAASVTKGVSSGRVRVAGRADPPRATPTASAPWPIDRRLPHSRGAASPTLPQRAAALIDILADSRPTPLTPKVVEPVGPLPVADVPVTDVPAAAPTDGIARAVDTDDMIDIVEPYLPAGPSLPDGGGILEGIQVATVTIDPADVPGWGGEPMTDEQYLQQRDDSPEPSCLAFLAVAAAVTLRRRRS